MGDEDWDAEISNSHMSSYVPVFEKDRYSSGANADTFNRTLASSSEMGDGSSRRDHFMRSGFASGRSLGNRGFSNNKFEEGDSSDFWRESGNHCEDNQTRNRGFSKRGGYQDGNDSEASGSSRRGGRGSFRGCRGGFGLGSPNSVYEQDEGTQRSGGIFGSRRSALSGADSSNDCEDDQARSRGFSKRGGYQDCNDSEASGSSRRGGRGSFRGCRGGFGLGSPNSVYEQDEGTQRSGGIFGSRRSALSGADSSNDCEDDQARSRGFSKRGGYQDCNDSEASGSSRRGGRGSFRGCRGGFGLGSPNSVYEQDEGTQRSGGIFGSRRSALSGADSSNDCEDDQARSRGFSKRGGYQDCNDSEASGSSRRGGRGSFRGCRGGFGLGSPNSVYEQDEGTQRSGGIFGSRRSALSGADSSNDCEDDQARSRGFSKRGGYQDCNDSEASGSSRRGGRGSFRGCRGGFGLGSPNSVYEQDEGTQRSGGIFGSRRSALSGAGDGDTFQSRSGSGSGRGGYKGLNEEVITGSGKNSWKSEAGGGASGDTQGRKVTYIPPPPPEDEDSIFAHYQTGINFDKYDTILVEVFGHDPPPAILTFEEANLCRTLNNNIAKAGYTKLTPVQKYGIPIILGGRDLMACAQTGSGKTAAFLLPILDHMIHDGITASRSKELQEPECIIVAPTRELISQIYLEARKFSFGTCVRAVVTYGGTQLRHSIRQIIQGCNILCATPGRLMDIIGKGKIGLRQVKYLVLDEADRMLDMGFGPEMKKLISYPGMPSKEQRQTLMFSATFPEEIQRLAGEFLKSNYLFVAVGQVGGACTDVQQTILQVGQYSKREKLVEILQNIGDERTMVFVETKKKADFIATFLCQEKISTTSIHGDREQREREQALGDFRCGKCPVLVATSVAGRGLDIENVQHVINFDLPSTIDEYVHRIGRTGRCGNTGRAISFFDLESDSHLAQPLVKVLSDAQQDVPAWLEEIAVSTYGPSFSGRTRGNVFASVDTRKNYHGRSSLNTAGFSSSQAPNPVDDESWD